MKRIDRRSFLEARLIIGNGFDLKCGLHSAYKDYFKSKESNYVWIKDVLNQAFINQREFGTFDINYFPSELRNDLNVWDVIFYLLSRNECALDYWCDVERVIQKCLFDDSNKDFSLCLFAKDIDNIIANKVYTVSYNNSGSFLLYHFLIGKIRRSIISDKKSFYHFLKNELIKFEKDFIEYLQNDVRRIDYQNNAILLLESIIGNDEYNITQVDSFNYTRFKADLDTFNNINGDYDFPIFGVDNSLINDSNDERKIFTKQFRRLERTIISNPNRSYCSDRCIYIYGHSLN